jgi:hypothetical protein
MQAWRKKGPLGKLHNINIWINRTEQRLQTFLKYSKNRRIPHDNKTRWSSWQRQIDKAINEEIMEAIDLYLDAYGDSDVASDRLDEEEWKSLGKINDMLLVLKEATKSLEGSVVSLTKGLPAMDFILTKLPMSGSECRCLRAYAAQTDSIQTFLLHDLLDDSALDDGE